MLSKRYESTEVDRRTWLHVPSGTHWSTSSDTHQVVEICTTRDGKAFFIYYDFWGIHFNDNKFEQDNVAIWTILHVLAVFEWIHLNKKKLYIWIKVVHCHKYDHLHSVHFTINTVKHRSHPETHFPW